MAEVVAEKVGFAGDSLGEGDGEESVDSPFTSFVPFSAPVVLSALILPSLVFPFPFSPEFDFEDLLSDFLVDFDSGLDVALISDFASALGLFESPAAELGSIEKRQRKPRVIMIFKLFVTTFTPDSLHG